MEDGTRNDKTSPPSNNVQSAVHRNPFTKGGGVAALYTQLGRVPALLMRSAQSENKLPRMPQLATHTPHADECTSHAASRVQTLTLQRFQGRLTLFPKCFPPFPHGTCSLSYSGRYLATDGTYHRISAPIPRNATLWTFNRTRSQCCGEWEFHPSFCLFPEDARSRDC